MPELPEVETIRRGLEQKILNQPIAHIEVRLAKTVKVPEKVFTDFLRHKSFTALERRGKLLMFKVNNGEQYVLLHLKMTGQLIYRHEGEPQIAGGHPWPSYNQELPNKYTHVIFEFANHGTLYFNDQRQFGYIKLVDKATKEAEEALYGIEPLSEDFTYSAFAALFARRKTVLKALLLNQQLISGLGNIYADEVCFYAGVRPDRTVDTLSENELKLLYAGCQDIIARAVELRGTTIEDYTDSEGKRGNYSDELKVYKQTGKLCQRCGVGEIQKAKLAGRGTHWCPSCQK